MAVVDVVERDREGAGAADAFGRVQLLRLMRLKRELLLELQRR